MQAHIVSPMVHGLWGREWGEDCENIRLQYIFLPLLVNRNRELVFTRELLSLWAKRTDA